MPRLYEAGTWEGPPNYRWVKMYKGTRYRVTCQELGAMVWTKEATARLANDWWKKKKAEIDGVAVASHPHAEPLRDLGERLAYAQRQGLEREACYLAKRVEEVKTAPAGPLPMDSELQHRIKDLLAVGVVIPPDLPLEVLAQFFGREEVWDDRLSRNGGVAKDKTVAAHAVAWQKHQQALVAADQMTPDRCNNNRSCMEHFKRFVGEEASVEGINADLLERFYHHCIGQVAARKKNSKEGWSVAYARDVFGVVKGFVRWLAGKDVIALPKNIGSKSFKFGSGAKTVKTWTVEEYNLAVEKAPGKLKLALLLMANCGMTQVDISDLQDSEVDWVEGRIIRKRSKTDDCENVPTVNYKLWPLTFALLKKYRSGTDRVLLTESGQPYVRKEMRQGRYYHTDGFKSNYNHLQKRLGLPRCLKELRKTAATMLEKHKDYGRYTSYFLGHSPRTVADKHYATPSRELFDEAVLWLGRQLGMVEG